MDASSGGCDAFVVQGKLSDLWATVTKGAIAEAVLSLTKLDEARRQPAECIKTHTVGASSASVATSCWLPLYLG